MVKQSEDVYWHGKLPIGKDEKILGVYSHHWFIYAEIWLVAFFVILGIMGVAVFATSSASTASEATSSFRPALLTGALLFSAVVLLFAIIPAWLKSQEKVILTEEAILQVLQPGLFSSKTSQLNLQHVADVTAHQDFFGTMFGYGKIIVETPGEQMNYVFHKMPNAQEVARAIIEAHENYDAALQSGRIPTTYSAAMPMNDQQPVVDPAEYQEFLAFKKAMEDHKAQETTEGSQQEPKQ